MNAAIDASGIKLVIEEKVFAFKDNKEAHQCMVSLLCSLPRDDMLMCGTVGTKGYRENDARDRFSDSGRFQNGNCVAEHV